jgi:hypothetical protein
VRVGGLLVAMLALALAACGSTEERARQASATAQEVCTPPEGEEEGIDGTPPAHPIAIGPDGPVVGVPRYLDGSALYISDSGVCSIAATAPGTWALTSLVVDERDAPVPGAIVVLEALEPPGLDVSLATNADEDGAFAFVNVPVRGAGTCYRTRVVAPGFIPYVNVEVVTPETYAGNVILSRKGYFDGEGAADRRACVE